MTTPQGYKGVKGPSSIGFFLYSDGIPLMHQFSIYNIYYHLSEREHPSKAIAMKRSWKRWIRSRVNIDPCGKGRLQLARNKKAYMRNFFLFPFQKQDFLLPSISASSNSWNIFMKLLIRINKWWRMTNNSQWHSNKRGTKWRGSLLKTIISWFSPSSHTFWIEDISDILIIEVGIVVENSTFQKLIRPDRDILYDTQITPHSSLNPENV